MAPLISIITLNYNQAFVTREFLDSAAQLSYPNFEILVCDMNSEENPANAINEKKYTNTRLLLSAKNRGFAGGNNWGMRQAKGDYYFIVNNDTIVTPDLLSKLLEPFRNNSSVGVVCPKIKMFHRPDTIEYAGFKPMNAYT